MKLNRKSLIVIYLLCFIKISAFSLDWFSFSLSPEFGLMNGHINEYVFDETCNNTENILSKLDWDLLNAPYGELNLSFDFFDKLYLSGSGKALLPGNTGYMQDYDWLNDSHPTSISNYSKHTNRLTDWYSISVSAGGIFYPQPSLKVTPFIGFEYEYLSFDAMDGYREYETESWVRKEFEGRVITYTQEYLIFSLGISLECELNPNVILSSKVSLSPNLSFADALDFHYLREFEYTPNTSTLFWDNFEFITVLKCKTSVQYKITEQVFLGSFINFHIIPVAEGFDAWTKTDKKKNFDRTSFTYTGVNGGTSAILISTGISLTYRFN